ncbi:MAG: hypothetical protein V1720_08555 [bacterium]
MNQQKMFKYKGAEALIALHRLHILSFVNTWKSAKAANIKLPETDDEWYASIDMLGRHILNSARGYNIWICKKLELPEPEIIPAPQAEELPYKIDEYTEHLLENWGLQLCDVPEDKFHGQTYTSNWGVEYCVDAMMEHAVMHPIRHEFQLINLTNAQKK